MYKSGIFGKKTYFLKILNIIIDHERIQPIHSTRLCLKRLRDVFNILMCLNYRRSSVVTSLHHSHRSYPWCIPGPTECVMGSLRGPCTYIYLWLLLGGLNGHSMPCSSCGSSFGSASKNSFCMKRSNLPVHSSVDNELQHIFPLKLRQSWRLMLSSWLLVQEKEGEETSTSEAELESWKLFENFQGLNKEEIRCHKLLKLPASGINNFKVLFLRPLVNLTLYISKIILTPWVWPLFRVALHFCRTEISPFGNLVAKSATSQKGLEACSLLSSCCQITL